MANFFGYTANSNQGFNSISNGTFQSSPTFGNFSNVPNQATYITRTNPAQIQTPTYLSYTQQQQQVVTTVGETAQYQQTQSFYTSAAPSTPVAQQYNSKAAASYFHQQPQNQQQQQQQQSSFYQQEPKPRLLPSNALVMKAPQSYTVGSGTGSNFSTLRGQSQVSTCRSAVLQSTSQNYTNTNKDLIKMFQSNPTSLAVSSHPTNFLLRLHQPGSTSNSFSWRQRRLLQRNRCPKPILASEVKAYVYAWLGKHQSRPNYTVTAHVTDNARSIYVAELVATGFDYVGRGCAGSKKDAQTRAAWDFCDHLVDKGRLDQSQLPTREAKFESSNNHMPSTYQPIHYTDDVTNKSAEAEPTNKSRVEEASEVTPSVNQDPRPLMSIQVEVPKRCDTSLPVIEPSKSDEAVGEEYVKEVVMDGKGSKFKCSLCECEFNSSDARLLHIRGRRHRLSYKRKVDPTLDVQLKLNHKQKQLMLLRMKMDQKKEEEIMFKNQERWWRREEQSRYYYDDVTSFPPHPPANHFHPRPIKTRDDSMVIRKHHLIFPQDQQLKAVQQVVHSLEGALQSVANKIHEQEMVVFTASHLHDKTRQSPPKLVREVVRIGALAKGLLLCSESRVELVMVCSEKPTRGLLSRVLNLLPDALQTRSKDVAMDVRVHDDELVVTARSLPPVTAIVYMTSPRLRHNATDDVEAPNVLDKVKCLDKLTRIRRTRWIQNKANRIHCYVITARLLKDFRNRQTDWKPITDWMLELFIQRVLSSSPFPLSPSSALTRVFEALSSGLLLSDGSRLLDPLESHPTDALQSLTPQQREDITSSAQNALRQIAFKKLPQLLALPPFDTDEAMMTSQKTLKRVHSHEESDLKVMKMEP